MNDRVTCEAVMAAFVDTDQLGNQQLFDEVAKQLGIPDEVRHASAPVGRAGKRYKLFERQCRWHQQSLRQAGVLERVDRGVWRLSDEARQSLTPAPSKRVLLRFMYEFWLRWYKPPVMGFEASPVPDFIEAKACMVGGIEAGILAGEIWYQPGISLTEAMAKTADICDRTSGDVPSAARMKEAIDALIADSYMVSTRPSSDGSPSSDLWLTGTNPLLLTEQGRLASRGTHVWTSFFGNSTSR